MTGVWPWLAVAGAGALHGLNPATGWGLVAARGVRTHGRTRAWRGLAPIALGNAAAAALLAALAALGWFSERGVLPWIAGGGALLAAAMHLSGRRHQIAGQAGLALWSLAMGALHGAGMMLVPALLPLCVSASPAREIAASGSLLLALAALGVHLAAMLSVTAALASLAGRGWIALRRRTAGPAIRGGFVHRFATFRRPPCARSGPGRGSPSPARSRR